MGIFRWEELFLGTFFCESICQLTEVSSQLLVRHLYHKYAIRYSQHGRLYYVHRKQKEEKGIRKAKIWFFGCFETASTQKEK